MPKSKGFADGEFSSAMFNEPIGLALMDNNNFAFVCDKDNHRIRMLSFIHRKVSTIAGTGLQGHLDGVAVHSLWSLPFAIAINKLQNKLYISDCSNYVIREIDITTLKLANNSFADLEQAIEKFIVKTICGKPRVMGCSDGIGDIALFCSPQGLAFSNLSENILFICDGDNNCIKKLDVMTSHVTTIAGLSFEEGFADGNSHEAKFHWPRGLCPDECDNLYVCDRGNHAIRKINRAGEVATIVRNSERQGLDTLSANPAIATMITNNTNIFLRRCRRRRPSLDVTRTCNLKVA